MQMENRSVKRISLSLPGDVYEGLETLVAQRGYENRSLAVADILREELVTQRSRNPQEVMAGSITLFYSERRPGLSSKLLETLRRHLKEVVSCLSVLLVEDMRMDVLVVQGPVIVLEGLLKELVTLKGVDTGKLTLTAAVLPPLYSKNEGEVP